jgi:hypothetical protein
LVGLLAGCSAYDSRYEFGPRPLEFGHSLPGMPDRAASVLLSVVGVRKRDAEAQLPASVEIRMRVDNQSSGEVRLDPAGLRLYAANLVPFPAPIAPAGVLVVAGGESGELTAYFPFPDSKVPGGFDLDGLGLRWTLELGSERSTGSVTFVRAERDAYGYDYGPAGVLGFGWGWPPAYYGRPWGGGHPDRTLGGHRSGSH